MSMKSIIIWIRIIIFRMCFTWISFTIICTFIIILIIVMMMMMMIIIFIFIIIKNIKIIKNLNIWNMIVFRMIPYNKICIIFWIMCKTNMSFMWSMNLCTSNTNKIMFILISINTIKLTWIKEYKIVNKWLTTRISNERW